MNGSTLILNKLLDAKADLTQPDQYGRTPLVLAEQFHRTEAVGLLKRRLALTGSKPSEWTYMYNPESTQLSEHGRSLKHPQGRRLVRGRGSSDPCGPSQLLFRDKDLRRPGRDQPRSRDLPNNSQARSSHRLLHLAGRRADVVG